MKLAAHPLCLQDLLQRATKRHLELVRGCGPTSNFSNKRVEIISRLASWDRLGQHPFLSSELWTVQENQPKTLFLLKNERQIPDTEGMTSGKRQPPKKPQPEDETEKDSPLLAGFWIGFWGVVLILISSWFVRVPLLGSRVPISKGRVAFFREAPPPPNAARDLAGRNSRIGEFRRAH
jgi:hypothetical protein